jgi:hypothetical protein
MKLEINSRKKFRKLTNVWKLNNTLPNKQYSSSKKLKVESRKYFELYKVEDTTY